MAKPLRPIFLGPVLERMRETSSLRKQEGETSDICPSRKPTPNQSPQSGFAASAAVVRGKRKGEKRPYRQTSGHQGDQQPQQQPQQIQWKQKETGALTEVGCHEKP